MDPFVIADLAEILREQVHEMLDFFALAADVFRGERIDREDADPDVEAPFEHLLQLVAALRVAIEDVAQTDLPREPAVPHPHHSARPRGHPPPPPVGAATPPRFAGPPAAAFTRA